MSETMVIQVAATEPAKPLQWRLQKAEGQLPSPRSGHSSVADPTGTVIYTFGGYHNNSCYDELYQYHVPSKTWKKLTTTGTRPARSASQSVLLYGSTLVVFGGSGVPFGRNNSNSIHVCDLTTLHWSLLDCHGKAPCPRYGQSMVLNPTTGDVFVFGGTSGVVFFADLYRLHLPTQTWYHIQPINSTPPPSYRHEAVLFGERIYVFGGGAPNPALGTALQVHMYDIARNQWETLSTPTGPAASQPRARRSHGCAMHAGKVYITGGTDGKSVFNDVWGFDLSSHTWKQMTALGLSEHYFHSSVATCEGGLHVVGGCVDLDGNQRSNSILSLRLAVPSLQSLCLSAIATDHRLAKQRAILLMLPEAVSCLLGTEQARLYQLHLECQYSIAPQAPPLSANHCGTTSTLLHSRV